MKVITETQVIFNRAAEAEKIANFPIVNSGWVRKDGDAETVFWKRTEHDGAVPTDGKQPCCLSCSHMVQKIIDGFPIPSCPFFGYLSGDPAKTVCNSYKRGNGA